MSALLAARAVSRAKPSHTTFFTAAAAAALQVTQMGQRWYLNHQLRFELERAGAQLYLKRGNYDIQDPEDRFSAFADEVERIMLESESSYIARIAQLGRDEGANNALST